MTNLERTIKRNTKITRTMIRLKHSLAADDEIEAELERQKELLVQGQIPVLELKLSDLGE